MRRSWKLILLASILLLGDPSFAQPSRPQPLASLLANVIDRKGDAVRNLTKDNFRVKVNGHPANLKEASYTLAPRRIVLLLDMSASMAGDLRGQKWQIGREAAVDLLAETPEDVPIALLTFSDKVDNVFDFSQSRNSMLAWLKQGIVKEGARKDGDSRIHGRTALFDSILTAAKTFGTVHSGDAIYVITDADDNRSRIHAREIRKLLLDSQIRLFAFLLPEPWWPSSEPQQGIESVEEIARATGGFVFGIAGHNIGVSFPPSVRYAFDYNDRTRQTIKFYTHALNIQVSGFYNLSFDLPMAPEKPRKVSLEVVDGNGKFRKDVVYTYSTALLPQRN